MSFFKSEIVRKELQDISQLQEEIYSKVFEFSSMDKDKKLEHIRMLEELLSKQQVLYTRMSLSDDPEAKGMRSQLITQAKQLGFPEDVDLGFVFSNMNKIIDNMKKSLEEWYNKGWLILSQAKAHKPNTTNTGTYNEFFKLKKAKFSREPYFQIDQGSREAK